MVDALQGTHLDLKMFVPLLVKYQMEGGAYPSAPASRYMHEDAMGRPGLRRLDEINRSHLEDYVANVHRMEAITRWVPHTTRTRGHNKRTTHAAFEGATFC